MLTEHPVVKLRVLISAVFFYYGNNYFFQNLFNKIEWWYTCTVMLWWQTVIISRIHFPYMPWGSRIKKIPVEGMLINLCSPGGTGPKSTNRLCHFSRFSGVFDQLYWHSEILKKGAFSQVYHWKLLWRGNSTLFEVVLGDFCQWKGMVKSSGESSLMGYQPNVVAEPYGGLWVKTFPLWALLTHLC